MTDIRLQKDHEEQSPYFSKERGEITRPRPQSSGEGNKGRSDAVYVSRPERTESSRRFQWCSLAHRRNIIPSGWCVGVETGRNKNGSPIWHWEEEAQTESITPLVLIDFALPMSITFYLLRLLPIIRHSHFLQQLMALQKGDIRFV